MLVVTSDEIPGWEIQGVCGHVVGVTVRPKSAAGINRMAGLSLDMSNLNANLAHARNQAIGGLIEEARKRGGNAIVAMRFETIELNEKLDEICTYGTAVQAVPVTAAAKQTAKQFGYEL